LFDYRVKKRPFVLTTRSVVTPILIPRDKLFHAMQVALPGCRFKRRVRDSQNHCLQADSDLGEVRPAQAHATNGDSKRNEPTAKT